LLLGQPDVADAAFADPLEQLVPLGHRRPGRDSG
jgi:hypothetical protein